MHLHANAALGLAGRRRLVELVERGHSLRAAASALGVAPATAHRWWSVGRGQRGRARGRRLPCRPLEPAPSLPAPAHGRTGGADPGRPCPDQPRPGPPGPHLPPGAFDAVLAATAMSRAGGLVSADGAFASVAGLDVKPLDGPWVAATLD